MAFVARRSSDGSVVDRQQVSGRGTVRPASQSDISDEDSSESVLGYTNRTYGAPTVRYVGQDEDRDAMEPQLDDEDFVDSLGDRADNSESETDSILSFCKELDQQEANDALLNERMSFTDEKAKVVDKANADDVFHSGMNKGDEAAATDTETVMNFDHDVQSLSSLSSCTPTVTQRCEDVDNLDNISGRTFFKEEKSQSISIRTFCKDNKLDGLSARTFHKQASSKEANQGQISNRTYNLSCSGNNRNHDASSMSTCSWSDMYRGALQPADGCSGMPPLSLASAVSDSSTCYKQLEELKERPGPQAFEDWKARKAAQKQKNLLAAKLEREKREAEAALRQKYAQEHFQEWCRRKEEEQQRQKQKKSSTCSTSSGSVSGSSTGPARKVSPESTKKRLQEWERVKKEQQQLEKERLNRLQCNKQKLEDERRQRRQGAWQNWMKQVDKRAKPVPLNQGFDTLRGTISNIYINPVQWVSNIDPQDSGRSR
uniref:CG18266 protein n=1 Tax=Drosophila simulans TaxID=7240 RepID=A0AMY0_DROSI|nr:CG18266 [Drosophila simulans]